jgi:hypothetical protein
MKDNVQNCDSYISLSGNIWNIPTRKQIRLDSIPKETILSYFLNTLVPEKLDISKSTICRRR